MDNDTRNLSFDLKAINKSSMSTLSDLESFKKKCARPTYKAPVRINWAKLPINGIKLNAILIAKKTRIAPIEIPHFSFKLESASFFNSEIDFIRFFLSNAKIINSFHTHIIKYPK